MAGVAIAVGVLSTVSSQKQQKKAFKAQERAKKIDQKRQDFATGRERRKQDFATGRERRKQVRAARVARAEILSASSAGGTSSTSKTASISGNIQSELGGNLSFLDSQQGFTSAIGKQMSSSARATQKAGEISAYGDLASKSILMFD
jgi:hypothetical protein